MKLTEKIRSLINSIPDKYKSPEIMKMIKNEIDNMVWEIQQSEKGERKTAQLLNKEDGQGYIKYVNVSRESTFPEYLQVIFNGQGTAKKFIEAARRGKGIVWERIALEAINRLEKGYKNYHGYDTPNDEFLDLVRSEEVPF